MIVPIVAVMFVMPGATPVATPAVEIVAVAVMLEAQVTIAVRFIVDWSSYVPVAVNCWVVFFAIDMFAGVTAIETRCAGAFTVRVVEPETAPLVAEIAVVPAATPVARPEVETVAVAVIDEAQVAVVEMSFVVLSLKVPVAVNCWVAPVAIDGVVGVTAIETSVAMPPAMTVRVVEPITPLVAAVIVVMPAATAVARPVDEIVAVPVVLDVQVAVDDTSIVMPLLSDAVATNCCVEPTAIDMLVGVTEIEVTVAC
jgi:hypothetical protein